EGREVPMGDRMSADLDTCHVERAELADREDPRPAGLWMDPAEPPRDHEDRGGSVQVPKARQQRGVVVGQAVVEGQARRPGGGPATGQLGLLAERQESVAPST